MRNVTSKEIFARKETYGKLQGNVPNDTNRNTPQLTAMETAQHCDTLHHTKGDKWKDTEATCVMTRTATHCNTLQRTLQHTATHCNIHKETYGKIPRQRAKGHEGQHTATHCNAHCNAHCNTLQHTATCIATNATQTFKKNLVQGCHILVQGGEDP